MSSSSRKAPSAFGLLVSVLFATAGGRTEDEAPPSIEDLDARRAALEKWTFEPIALDAGSFLFHLDRRDSSFFILERRTGVKWFSSWGRRGFASVLAASEDGGERWLPVDRVKSLVADAKRIRISGGSSAGELPAIRLEVKLLEGTAGISLGFEVEAAARARVKAVRILDEALWLSDSDDGGSLVPRGPGEWLSSRDMREARVLLDGVAGKTPLTLLALGIASGKSPLLVRWSDPAATLTVERRRVGAPGFPGRHGTFHGVEVRISPGEGPASGRVDLHPLGMSEIGISDAARALRELDGSAGVERTLRHRTAARPELAPFSSAAVFRPAVGAGLGFREVAAFAERLHRELGVEDAAIIVSGWKGNVSGGSAVLPVREDAGGSEGLSECARRVHAAGHVFGLELDPAWLAGAAPAGSDAFWKAALEEGMKPANLPALEGIASPEIILLAAPPLPDRPGALDSALEARSAFAGRLAEVFGLVGVKGGSGIDASWASLVEGALEPWRGAALPEGAWPFLPAAAGVSSRLTVGAAGGLGPGDDGLFLSHLLAGETPLYAFPMPGEAPGKGAGAYSVDEGWCAGKGLSARERFIKNTYEAAAHAARLRARNPMVFHRKIDAAGHVRETFFGIDMRVLVNFGPGNHEDEDDGILLPPGGFLIKHPNLLVFHALRANGVAYERPAFFVVRSLEGKMYLRAERVSIYHGFGPDEIQLGGKTFRVERESIVKIW